MVFTTMSASLVIVLREAVVLKGVGPSHGVAGIAFAEVGVVFARCISRRSGACSFYSGENGIASENPENRQAWRWSSESPPADLLRPNGSRTNSSDSLFRLSSREKSIQTTHAASAAPFASMSSQLRSLRIWPA